jgi:twinkle protein
MITNTEDGEFIRHEACTECGSSDGRAVYSNGSSYCFVCSSWKGDAAPNTSFNKEATMSKDTLYHGEYVALNKRRISKDICRKYGYHLAEDFEGNLVQVANYFDESKKLTGQKVRYADKTFRFKGESKVQLFGQQLFASGGRKLVITEGEIDALSVAEAYEGKWPVVSIINGSQSAVKNIKANLEWVLSFKEVILWFDDDSAGHKASEECAELFKPGQLKVMGKTGYKDANELLVAKGKAAVVNATYNAEEMRIDGVINSKDLWEAVSKEEVFETFTYPFPELEQKFKGIRKGELITFTAGSGVGKSTIVKEITYHLLMKEGLKIGYVALEENVKRSALSFMGMYLNKPLFFEYDQITDKDKKDSFDATLGKGNLYFYDHFGSLDETNLLRKLRLLITQHGVDFIILDHISIVVSGTADGDERRAIDALMTNLRSLAEETQAGILIVSHLRRPQGDKGHEDGAQVTLSQLRGSGAIAQLSDGVIGVERDMQDAEFSDQVKLRVLKNRFVGDVGLADTLQYSKETGRMSAVESYEIEEEF